MAGMAFFDEPESPGFSRGENVKYTPTQVESIGRYFYAMSIASGVIVEKLYRLSGSITFEMVIYATIFMVTLLLGVRCHRGTQKGG